MCFDIGKSLYKENKALKSEIKQLQLRLKFDKEGMIVEILNTYLKERNLYSDFEKFCKTYVGNVIQDTNKLQEIYDKL